MSPLRSVPGKEPSCGEEWLQSYRKGGSQMFLSLSVLLLCACWSAAIVLLPVWAAATILILSTVAVFGAIGYYTTTSKNPADC